MRYCYFYILQNKGEGEGLGVFLENVHKNISRTIWSLRDSWTDKAEWTQGRVLIHGDDFCQEIQDDQYRVRYIQFPTHQ